MGLLCLGSVYAYVNTCIRRIRVAAAYLARANTGPQYLSPQMAARSERLAASDSGASHLWLPAGTWHPLASGASSARLLLASSLDLAICESAARESVLGPRATRLSRAPLLSSSGTFVYEWLGRTLSRRSSARPRVFKPLRLHCTSALDADVRVRPESPLPDLSLLPGAILRSRSRCLLRSRTSA